MINPMTRSSPVRMMGMASGMDTEFIIQQAMRMHQMRIDSQFRARQNLIWRQDLQTSIRDQVATFRNSFLVTTGPASMLNRNLFSASVASAAGRNSDAVTVRALAGSSTNSITIGRIQQLAGAARVQTSEAARTKFTGIQATAGLSSLPVFDQLGFDVNRATLKNTAGQDVSVYQSTVDGINWNSIAASTKFDVEGTEVTLYRANDGKYSFTSGSGTAMISGIIEFNDDGEAIVSDIKGDGAGALVAAIERDLAKDSGVITNDGVAVDPFTKSHTVLATNGTSVEITRLENGQLFNGDTIIKPTDFTGSSVANVRGDNGQTVRISQEKVNEIDWDSITTEKAGFTLRAGGVNHAITLTKVPSSTPGEHTYSFTTGSGANEITGTLTFHAETGDAIVNVTTPAPGENEDRVNALKEMMEKTINMQGGSISLVTRGEQTIPGENGDDDIVIENAILSRTALPFYKEATIKAADDTTDVTFVRLENGAIRNNGSNVNYFAERDIQINDKTITLRSDMSINSMLTAVNNSDAGVRMRFEPLTGRFSLESTGHGASAGFDISNAINGSFFAQLGFEPEDGSMSYKGKDAIVWINGTEITHSSNTLQYGGVAITLNRTTDGEINGASGDGNITINVRRDATETIDRIKEFVNAYNSIIQRIENLTRERKAPHEVGYGPLTEEEKRGMSDREIEQWEAIAKKGILRNDRAMQDLANRLRNDLFVKVESAGLSPFQIGLTTGTRDSGTGGQIVLDEDRLRAALESDPDRVANVFLGQEGVNDGFLWRMRDIMNDFSGAAGSANRSIRSLEDSIRRNSEQMTRLQERMFAEEDRLYRQFAAMETALSRMQSQGDWFNSMLGGLNQK